MGQGRGWNARTAEDVMYPIEQYALDSVVAGVSPHHQDQHHPVTASGKAQRPHASNHCSSVARLQQVDQAGISRSGIGSFAAISGRRWKRVDDIVEYV